MEGTDNVCLELRATLRCSQGVRGIWRLRLVGADTETNLVQPHGLQVGNRSIREASGE